MVLEESLWEGLGGGAQERAPVGRALQGSRRRRLVLAVAVEAVRSRYWKCLEGGGVTQCQFMCPTHSEAKQTQTQNVGIWSRESFIAEPSKENRRLLLVKPLNSLKGFRKAFFRAWRGRGVPRCVISSCTVLWLLDGFWSWGLPAHDRVVRFFHLVVVLASGKLRK